MTAADAMTPANKRPRRKKEVLTAERARELLSYDPGTGTITWRVRRQRVAPGMVAGSVSPKDGYRRLFIAGRSYLAHRVAWLLFHGRWPDGQLDHVDGVRSFNQIDNLRQAGHGQNQCNRRWSRRPASGYRGVYRSRDRYVARISVGGKTIILGRFRLIEIAVEVYSRAAKLHFGDFAPLDQVEDVWVG